MKFSVVVPALNEGSQIGSALRRLKTVSGTSPMEIILVDGGSDDNTVEQSRNWADKLITLPGSPRGAQWHAGAQAADGDLLFFLPADAQPPSGWQQLLEHFWLSREAKTTAATVFSVDYGAEWGYRLASSWANAAAAWAACPTSDHGFCVPPDVYRNSGGFPTTGDMTDMAFAARLRKLGRISRISGVIHPAARRLRQIGPLAGTAELSWRLLLSRFSRS